MSFLRFRWCRAAVLILRWNAVAMAGNTSSSTSSIFHPCMKEAAMAATRLTPAPTASHTRGTAALNNNDECDNIQGIESVKMSFI